MTTPTPLVVTPASPAVVVASSPAAPSMAPAATPVAPVPTPVSLASVPLALQSEARTASEHAVALAAPSSSSSDMISLNDFVVQDDGHVADRNTASSVTSASTHVYSLHSEDDLLAIGSHLVAPTIAPVVPPPQQQDDTTASNNNEPEEAEVPTGAEASESVTAERADPSRAPRGGFDVLDQRVLSSTDINIACTGESDQHAERSDMISLTDLAALVSSTGGVPEAELRKAFDPVQREIDAMTHVERSSLLHPLIAEMYGFLPDLHNVVKDKPVDSLLMKKGMVDEIQDILQSLQMEAQFERHSHLGVGLLPNAGSSTSTSLDAASTGSSTLPLPPASPQQQTAGRKRCYQCGKPGELADLALEGGRRELYCQDCWEIFFYNEDRLGDSDAITPRSFRDSADDAFKYSFHDSAASRSDMIGPWRYHNNGDSTSSIRDSTTTIGSSITDRADEVWL